jgi:FAD/FMN-containing dehydrogenase
MVRADANRHPGLYWAARGAGPGFFGAVARFHLRLYPRPNHVANGVYLYPIDCLEEVFRWAYEIGPRVPRTMELMVVVHRDAEGELEIAVTGPVLAGSAEEAAEALALLETCVVRERAKGEAPNVEVQLADLYAAVHGSYPDGHRYAVDNMWTHAPVEELLPGLRRIAETMPAAPSHMLWMNWGPSPARPEMAYSLEDDTYIALYGVWQDAVDDEANAAWPAERMGEMEHLSSGIQLADENLGRRPARFARDENMVRLDRVRAEYDPDGLFHPWMGRI